MLFLYLGPSSSYRRYPLDIYVLSIHLYIHPRAIRSTARWMWQNSIFYK